LGSVLNPFPHERQISGSIIVLLFMCRDVKQAPQFQTNELHILYNVQNTNTCTLCSKLYYSNVL